MANSANITSTVNARPERQGKIIQTRNILTSTATDLVVHTPPTGYSVYLKSMFGSEGTAANLTIKQRSASLTGTVATTNTSTTLTGTGTAFLTDYATLPPGAEIVIDAAGTLTRYAITSVTNNTSMEIAAATSSVSGKTHARQETIIIPELAANQGMLNSVQPDCWICATKTSYALVLNTSVAISELFTTTQEGIS